QVDRDRDRDADEEAEGRGEDGDGRAGDPGIRLGDADAAKQGRRDQDYERSDAEEAEHAGPCARVALRAGPAFGKLAEGERHREARRDALSLGADRDPLAEVPPDRGHPKHGFHRAYGRVFTGWVAAVKGAS